MQNPPIPMHPTPPRDPDILNEKQTNFTIEYPKDFNATAAARRAGYAKENADVAGPRLLRHPAIIKALAKAHAERDAERQIEKKKSLNLWLDHLEAIALFNPVDLLEPGTNHLRDLQDLPEKSHHAIVIRLKGDRENPTAPAHIDSITTRDKLRALGMLIKIHSAPQPAIAPLHDRSLGFCRAINGKLNHEPAVVEHYMGLLVGEGHTPAIFAARMNAYYGALDARMKGNGPETIRLVSILLADPSTYTPDILASIPPRPVVTPEVRKPFPTTPPPPPEPTRPDPISDHDRQALDNFLAHPVLPPAKPTTQQATPPTPPAPAQPAAPPRPAPALKPLPPIRSNTSSSAHSGIRT